MAPKVPKSFVPKQPVASVRRPRASNRSSSILSVAGLVIFVAAIALGGLAFGYEFLLKQEKEGKNQELSILKESVDRGVVEELARLSSRLSSAEELLDNHLAPTALFSLLEQDTIQGVQFTDFQMQLTEDGDTELQLNGIAADFNTLAYQSQRLSQSPHLRNQIFGDITVEETDTGADFVSFGFTATIARDLLLARNSIVLPEAPVVEEEPEETSTTEGEELPVDTESTAEEAPGEESVEEEEESADPETTEPQTI